MITEHDLISFIMTSDPTLPRNVDTEFHHWFATVVEEGEVGLNLPRFLAILSDEERVGSSAPKFNEVCSKEVLLLFSALPFLWMKV